MKQFKSSAFIVMLAMTLILGVQVSVSAATSGTATADAPVATIIDISVSDGDPLVEMGTIRMLIIVTPLHLAI